jgi:hypothetical protein
MANLQLWIADVIHWCFSDSGTLTDFYSNELRGNLFNGFLTIAAFLLSVKTFIVILLQKEVYGTDSYRQRIIALRELNSKLTIYGPLRRLNSLMTWTVALTLAASMLQLTVGLFRLNLAAMVCIMAAAFCAVLLFYVVWVMREAMQDYFEQLEKEQHKLLEGGAASS